MEESFREFAAFAGKPKRDEKSKVQIFLLNLLKANHPAVLPAYGFDAKKDLLAQLFALYLAVAQRIEAGTSVTAPGVLKNYPKPKKLETADCIQPAS